MQSTKSLQSVVRGVAPAAVGKVQAMAIARIALDSLGFAGNGLNRPECVLAHRSGLLFAADWTGNGGVAVIAGDGGVRRVLARDVTRPLRPNGIALEPGGSLLLAHLGADDGGVWRLLADGTVEPVLVEVAGRPVPPSNYPHLDAVGRLWLTISTRQVPRALGYRPGPGDGMVIVKDRRGARVVADGLGYTNECLVHPDGEHLYVNETFARRLTAFEIAAAGELARPRTVATFGHGTFPDGLTFDAEGNVWVTSFASNRVLVVHPDGGIETVLEDSDPEHLDWVERAFQSGSMGRAHLDTAKGRVLRNISSLAFGGEDLRTAWLGCLLDDRLPSFRSPIAGHPPPHWAIDLGPLAA
jgi:sugar lactone lactonase YvrE